MRLGTPPPSRRRLWQAPCVVPATQASFSVATAPMFRRCWFPTCVRASLGTSLPPAMHLPASCNGDWPSAAAAALVDPAWRRRAPNVGPCICSPVPHKLLRGATLMLSGKQHHHSGQSAASPKPLGPGSVHQAARMRLLARRPCHQQMDAAAPHGAAHDDSRRSPQHDSESSEPLMSRPNAREPTAVQQGQQQSRGTKISCGRRRSSFVQVGSRRCWRAHHEHRPATARNWAVRSALSPV
jgi:hypothetical protein